MAVDNMILEAFRDYKDIFAIFGAVSASFFALKLTLSILHGFKVYALGRMGLATKVKATGKWAVVTGATDGIGKAYALQLAKQGLNIVLISRSPQKLTDVALEIESKLAVKTRSIPIDFGGGPEIYTKIKQELAGLEIGVLVNNVGISYQFPEYFTELENLDEMCQKMISINITSVVMMSRIILPEMIERRKGVIINVASASGISPVPFLGLYSATKAFVDFFSRSLQGEYGSKGIIIQSVMPFFVSTKMSRLRPSFSVPTPNDYAKSALCTLGLEDRTFGCISHALQGWVIKHLPEWLVTMVSNKIHKSVRAKALKRKAQKKQ
ncbi:very-long-chain 3-oxoacyl-CoA reductase [Lingula anatina]|uniref:Very-long-chain 3-oxoacyl-CoA reductase n=1 Tax=Lingula anatina TaxID=7574 RepID=A0A1S3J2G2_LINAN|nr:very-long-chain 3-oxoacyl-CoA reductase [Lingula anatina]|eukprot:XP_013404590.1 very-long-chain 3-oxoacyl-CoA reductase [Lingula anatina]